MDLRNLYQEIIIDHNRSPRNFGKMENATQEARGFNPLCGDEIHLYLLIKDEIITDIRFQGKGCAISTASASLLTDALRGKSVVEAVKLFQTMHALLTGKEIENPEPIGKLTVLAGVKEFPARVKCASLAWHTLESALMKTKEPACTE